MVGMIFWRDKLVHILRILIESRKIWVMGLHSSPKNQNLIIIYIFITFRSLENGTHNSQFTILRSYEVKSSHVNAYDTISF
jgi:hypothetical protein